MQIGRRTFVKLALAASVALSDRALTRPERTLARGEADWERAGLDGPVTRLFTPASGAFLAVTPGALHRSDDGGATWYDLPLPPEVHARTVTVDPTNHAVIYAGATAGLYKTSDAAASWQLMLPTSQRVLRIAVSPADPNLVYVGLAPTLSQFRFLRSGDGGANWDVLEERRAELCGWGVRVLEPHPTDAARLFRTAGCYAGRTTNDVLEQSTDQGVTWTSLLRPNLEYPDHLVGGRSTMPRRFYLAANRDGRAGGASLYRSDDDGGFWTEVLQFRGGGTMERAQGVPNVRIGGLAYDPERPDRVYVGLAEDGRGVKTSDDGGTTWLDLGRPDLPRINDLALGIDALNLYAATEDGLWRLLLDPGMGDA